MNILHDADALTSGTDRNDGYDHPSHNYETIVGLWSAYLRLPLTPRHVAHMMILLKVARDLSRPKRDNLVDIAGYARNAEQIEQGEAP